MNITQQIFEKDFSAECRKDAYLGACKWVAQNILNKVEVISTFWNITEVKEADSPTYRLTVYCALDENEIGSKFCKKCKEFHTSFFINQNYNCDSCHMKSYVNTIKSKLKIKRQYRRELWNIQ